jgi:ubiquinone/menaquinone biosynthesis C-methylase UbiE
VRAGFPAGARVTDLGCGSGVFTDVLQRSRHRFTGVDLSSKPIAIARSKFLNIEFIEEDVEHLPFLASVPAVRRSSS